MRTITIHYFILSGLLFFTTHLLQSQTSCPQLFFKTSDTTVCLNLDSLRGLEVYATSDAYPVQLMFNPSRSEAVQAWNYYLGRIIHQSVGWTKVSENLYRARFPKIRINDLHVFDFKVRVDTLVAVLSNYPVLSSNCVPHAKFTLTQVPQASIFPKYGLTVCNGDNQISIPFESTHSNYYGVLWTCDNPSFGIPTSGFDTIPAFKVMNTSGVDQVAKIIAKPRHRNGQADACVNYGWEILITATYDHKPVFTLDSTQLSVCLGDPAPVIKPQVAGNIGRLEWNPTYESVYLANYPFSGTDSVPSMVPRLRNTATYLKYAEFAFKAHTPTGCISDKTNYGFVLRPRAKMAPVKDRWICNGVKSPVISFSGIDFPGYDFRWTSDNPEFGLPAQGFYNVPAVKLLNPQQKEIQTKIRVVPRLPSQVWLATGPNTWATVPGYTYSTGEDYEEGKRKVYQFSTEGLQMPHPNGQQIYYTDGKEAKLHVLCIVPCFPAGMANQTLNLDAIPQKLYINSDGQNLYSVNHDSGSISRISTQNWVIVQQKRLNVPVKCSALSSDGNKLYVGLKAQNSIWVLNAHNLELLDQLQVAGEVEALLPFPDGSGLSLKFRDSSSVQLFDLSNKQTIKSFPVAASTRQMLAAKRTNKLYIYDDSVYPHKILVIDLATRQHIKTLTPKPYDSDRPCNLKSLQLEINPSGDLIYMNSCPFTVLNTYQDSINYSPAGLGSFKFFLSDGDCEGEAQEFTLRLGANSAPPTLTPIPNQFICGGEKSDPILFTQLYPGIDFSWRSKIVGTSYYLQTGQGDVPSVEAPSNNDRAVEYSLAYQVYSSFKVDDSLCIIDPIEFQYKIYGKIVANPYYPNLYDRVLTLGESTTNASVYLNHPEDFRIRYRWVNDNPKVGIPAEGRGNIPGIVNQNNTGEVQVANIVIYAERKEGQEWICAQEVHRYQLRLLPFGPPSLDSIANITVCRDDTIPSISFTSPDPGTVFRWRRLNNSQRVGLPADTGLDAIPGFKAVNPSERAIQGVFAVRPVRIMGSDSLVGPERQFSITVLPQLQLRQMPDQHFCSGSINYVNLNVPGGVFNWSFSKPAMISQVVGGNIYAANNISAPETGIFQASTIYPGQTCPADTIAFAITFYPKPVLPQIASATLCAGEVYTGIKPSVVAGFQFYWENNNSSIGLATNGSDSIPTFTTVPPGNNAQSASVNYMYFVPGLNKDVCSNLRSSFKINVVPVPNIKKTSDQTVLNCTPIEVPAFRSDWPKATFRWQSNRADLGLASEGVGTISGFISSNLGLDLAEMKIKVQPRLTELSRECIGKTDSFSIAVIPSNSLPNVDNVEICSNTPSSPISLGNTNYPWQKIRWNIDQPIGLPPSGVGNIPSFIPSILAEGKSARVAYNFEHAEQIIFSNTANSALSWLDPLKKTFLNRLTNESTPFNMVAHPDGSKIYVVRTFIDVINPLTQRFITTIDLREFCDPPSQMVFSKDGAALYLATEGCNYLMVVNTQSNRVEQKIQLDTTIGAFALSPGGFRMYVTSANGSKLYVVNPRTSSVIQTLPIGLNVIISNAKVDPTGSKLYLLSQQRNAVYTIDLANGQVLEKRNIQEPNEILIPETSNKVFIASIRSGAFCFDRQTGSPTQYISKSKSIANFALSPDGSTIYATHPRGDKIFMIGSSTGQIFDSVSVPRSNPYGIVAIPAQSCAAQPNSFWITVKTCKEDGFKTAQDTSRLLNRRPPFNVPIDQTAFYETPHNAAKNHFWVGYNEPNPFQDFTRIPFFLPVASPVKWELYNLAGQRVAQRSQEYAAGNHQLEIKASDYQLKAGVYYLNFQSALGNVSRKIIFIQL
jgi:DNA-binding beta-propeller fold protein YncE